MLILLITLIRTGAIGEVHHQCIFSSNTPLVNKVISRQQSRCLEHVLKGAGQDFEKRFAHSATIHV